MIRLEHVSKVFALPHERKKTLFHWATSAFGKKYDYEPLYALRDINLHVKDGEFLGVIGKNGSGKSTLLKVISGIYPPSSGNVDVADEIFPMLELGVGFQPEFTVKENILLYGTVLGFTRKQLNLLLHTIVEYAGLERFIDAKLSTLSLGMMLRLGFAVAVQSRASIFLVDEVLAVGDKDFYERCEQQFKKLKAEGRTVLFVSHDLYQVRRFCDRVIVMADGALVEDGPTESMIDRYSAAGSIVA